MEGIKIYQAASYVRLSKEDLEIANAAKAESESIQNQKRFIRDFVSSHMNIHLKKSFSFFK